MWLTDGGYRTKKEDVENAARPNAKFCKHIVPQTGAVLKFVYYVQHAFKDFDPSQMLSPDKVPVILNMS